MGFDPGPLDMIEYFYHRARWKLCFAWLPHRCALTNKLIWLTKAYQGTAVWTGPGDPIAEIRWHRINHHLIFQLKREYNV
jgi:hypothetical protein